MCTVVFFSAATRIADSGHILRSESRAFEAFNGGAHGHSRRGVFRRRVSANCRGKLQLFLAVFLSESLTPSSLLCCFVSIVRNVVGVGLQSDQLLRSMLVSESFTKQV